MFRFCSYCFSLAVFVVYLLGIKCHYSNEYDL